VCRNIKTLFNFEPPVTEGEINAASLQYVRKVTGFNKPSKANEAAFYSAVEGIARISERLLASLETTKGPGGRGGQGESALSPTIRRVIAPIFASPIRMHRQWRQRRQDISRLHPGDQQTGARTGKAVLGVAPVCAGPLEGGSGPDLASALSRG
jgi:hypothetical protein